MTFYSPLAGSQPLALSVCRRRAGAAAVRMPRPDASSAGAEVRSFTLDELLALVDEHRERAGELADVTLILGLTGLRFGQLRGLRVRDVTRVPYPALVCPGRCRSRVGRARSSNAPLPRAAGAASSPCCRWLFRPSRRGLPRGSRTICSSRRLTGSPACAELAPRRALERDVRRSTSARSAAHGRKFLDRGWGRHQDHRLVAGSQSQ